MDPITQENISFCSDDTLTIYTSKKALNINRQTKPRNILRIKTKSNIAATCPMASIATSGISSHLYGELQISNLEREDYLAGQQRTILNPTKRTRAIMDWVEEELKVICQQIQDSISVNRTYKELSDVEKHLDALRDMMAEFLDPRESSTGSADGPNKGGKGQKGKRPPIGEVVRVSVEDNIGFISIPIGIKIPLKHEAFDANNKIVSKATFRWESNPNQAVMLDGNGNVEGLNPGIFKVWAIENESNIQSTPLDVHVHDIISVTLNPQMTTLKQGERTSLNVQACDINNESPPRLALSYDVLPVSHGRVGRLGFFTAGTEAGSVKVTANFGKNKSSFCVFEITEEKKEKQISGYSGGGAPYIVFCGNPAPGCTDLPESERIRLPNPEDPTIILYEPFWRARNIIWINGDSSEARKIRDRARGTAVTGKINTKTFTEFLALKCFEILKLLRAEQILGEQALTTPSGVYEALAIAETEVAPFIEQAFTNVERWFVDD